MDETISEKMLKENDGPDFEVEERSKNHDLLTWMINVIIADGKIEQGERELLWSYSEKRGLEKEAVKALVIQARKQGRLKTPEPQTKEEAWAWLRTLIVAGLADGSISQDELSILRLAGRKLGFSDFELNRLIFNIRKDLSQNGEEEQENPFFG